MMKFFSLIASIKFIKILFAIATSQLRLWDMAKGYQNHFT